MGHVALFGTTHESYYTILANFYVLFTILSAKSFQFQQNKRILNRP